MGRDLLLPEHADSWNEFRARVEQEQAAQGGLVPGLCRTAAGLFFVSGLILIASAVQGGPKWLWLVAAALLGMVGVMAVRAMSNAERRASRIAQLSLLEQAWQEREGRW